MHELVAFCVVITEIIVVYYVNVLLVTLIPYFIIYEISSFPHLPKALLH